jgi:hypothetical protein
MELNDSTIKMLIVGVTTASALGKLREEGQQKEAYIVRSCLKNMFIVNRTWSDKCWKMWENWNSHKLLVGM